MLAKVKSRVILRECVPFQCLEAQYFFQVMNYKYEFYQII